MAVSTRARTIGGRYVLAALLGRGGMGEVWLAHDELLDRDVAVKVGRQGGDDADQDAARFAAEGELAARVNHPNIVQVYDAGVDDGTPYLVMERLTGRTLHHELSTGDPLAWPALQRLAADMLGALDASHAAGVLHRDITPSNVLEGFRGEWKLGDFGIAKSVEPASDLTRTGMVVGTDAYLAPERRRGEPATVRSDLYSLAVVLHEAATGRPTRPVPQSAPGVADEAAAPGAEPAATPVVPGTGEAVELAMDRPAMGLDGATGGAGAAEATGTVEGGRTIDTTPPEFLAALVPALSAAPEHRYASAAEMAAALLGATSAPVVPAAPLVAPSAEPHTEVLPAAVPLAADPADATAPLATVPGPATAALAATTVMPAAEPIVDPAIDPIANTAPLAAVAAASVGPPPSAGPRVRAGLGRSWAWAAAVVLLVALLVAAALAESGHRVEPKATHPPATTVAPTTVVPTTTPTTVPPTTVPPAPAKPKSGKGDPRPKEGKRGKDGHDH